GLSELSGDSKSTKTSSFIPDPNFGGVGSTNTAYEKDDKHSGSITDYDLSAVWGFADDRFQLSVGYVHSNWNGITDDINADHWDRFGVDPEGFPDRSNLDFVGWKLGLKWTFGK